MKINFLPPHCLFVKLFFLFSLLVSTPLTASKELNAHRDFQFWFYQSNVKKINPKTEVTLDVEFRFGANASKFYLFYVQSFWRFYWNKFFYVAPGYRQVYFFNPATRLWRPQYNPMLDIVAKFKVRKFDFTARSRNQLIIENSRPLFQERLRLYLIIPYKIGYTSPFIFDEVFFRNDIGFRENRFAFGAKTEFYSNLETELFFIFRRLISGERWVQHNVLELSLLYKF